MKKIYLLFLSFSCVKVFSQAGSLDATFGANGVGFYCYQVGYNPAVLDVALQSSGKIISYSHDYTIVAPLLSRWGQNGVLDTSFGINGFVSFSQTGVFSNGGHYAYKIAIQPDDKIVIMGLQQNDIFGNAYWVARLLPDGALDTSFNGTGYKDVTFGSVQDRATCIALQADGKILLGGTSGTTAQFFSVARLNSDGSYDDSFGTSGRVQIPFSGSESFVESMAVQPDGKIVLGGYTVGGAKDFALARINSNGSLDPTFGVNGKVVTDLLSSYSTIIRDILVEPDGKIIVSGNYSFEFNSRFCMVRYDANGTIDTSFGTNGLTVDTTYYNNSFNSIVRQIDGKIVTAGNVFGPSFIISRYNNNGTMDTTFGINGYVDAMPDTGSGSVSVLIQPDNKIVAVGSSYNEDFTQTCFSVVRLNSGTLSVEDFEGEEFALYPNPSSGIVSINTIGGMVKRVRVLNGLGQEVLPMMDLVEDNTVVDLSGLMVGVYWMALELGDGRQVVKKLVKR